MKHKELWEIIEDNLDAKEIPESIFKDEAEKWEYISLQKTRILLKELPEPEIPENLTHKLKTICNKTTPPLYMRISNTLATALRPAFALATAFVLVILASYFSLPANNFITGDTSSPYTYNKRINSAEDIWAVNIVDSNTAAELHKLLRLHGAEPLYETAGSKIFRIPREELLKIKGTIRTKAEIHKTKNTENASIILIAE